MSPPRDDHGVEVDWAELVRRATVIDASPFPAGDLGRIRLDLARVILAAEEEFAKLRAIIAKGPRTMEGSLCLRDGTQRRGSATGSARTPSRLSGRAGIVGGATSASSGAARADDSASPTSPTFVA